MNRTSCARRNCNYQWDRFSADHSAIPLRVTSVLLSLLLLVFLLLLLLLI